MHRLIILGFVVGITLFFSSCDQKSTPSKQSTYSGEAVIVRDNMGRLIREEANGYITIYEYPTHGDRRIPSSRKTFRAK